MVVSVQDLCDPSQCSLEEAVRLAKQHAAECQSYDLQLAQHLNELLRAPKVQPELVERTLLLRAEIAPPATLFRLLRSAMAHYDPHVRSRSAAALARHVENTAWLSKLVSDDDPRVRANTIEALWGRNAPDVEAIFLGALTDSHHRVAANAMYGLHLIDAAKYDELLGTFVRHSQAPYRSAAAWVLGKVGNAELIPLLRTLMFDKIPEVKHAAFRTLALLRSRNEAASKDSPDTAKAAAAA